ncbi:MAG TPA: cell wall hydrolase, partial [Clostridiaceae bacterium]|nr:cell wall hydrolase [Clostridiaceae bacterium]
PVYASVLEEKAIPEGIEVFKENTIEAVEHVVSDEVIITIDDEAAPIIAATAPQPDLVITTPSTAPLAVLATESEVTSEVEETEETTSATLDETENASDVTNEDDTEDVNEETATETETTTETTDSEEDFEAEEKTEVEESSDITASAIEQDDVEKTTTTELSEVVIAKATEEVTQVTETKPVDVTASPDEPTVAVDVGETIKTTTIAVTTNVMQAPEETEETETSITVSTGVAEPEEVIEEAKEAERIAAEKAAEEAAIAAEEKEDKETAERQKAIDSISAETMDLYLGMMAAECGANWDYEGCLRVAQVINNRVKCGYWGSDLHSVLAAPNQFTPYATGAWRTAPRTEAQRQAALDALAGETIFGEDVLYFCTDASYARSGWFQSLDHRDTYANTLFFAP